MLVLVSTTTSLEEREGIGTSVREDVGETWKEVCYPPTTAIYSTVLYFSS